MSSFKKANCLEDSTKRAELHLAAYVAEHNISYNAMEHFPKVIQKMCSDCDSEIAKNIKCGHTKCSVLVKNVMGKQNEINVIQILETSKFSLIIDESTDQSCTKHLALVCRYFDGKR